MIRSHNNRDVLSLDFLVPIFEVGERFDAKCHVFGHRFFDQLQHVILFSAIARQQDHVAGDRSARTSNDLESKEVGIEVCRCLRIIDLDRNMSESRSSGQLKASSNRGLAAA